MTNLRDSRYPFQMGLPCGIIMSSFSVPRPAFGRRTGLATCSQPLRELLPASMWSTTSTTTAPSNFTPRRNQDLTPSNNSIPFTGMTEHLHRIQGVTSSCSQTSDRVQNITKHMQKHLHERQSRQRLLYHHTTLPTCRTSCLTCLL